MEDIKSCKTRKVWQVQESINLVGSDKQLYTMFCIGSAIFSVIPTSENINFFPNKCHLVLFIK